MDPKQRSKADEGVSLMKEPSCHTQTSDAAADACTPTGLPGKDSDNYLDLFHLFFFWLRPQYGSSQARDRDLFRLERRTCLPLSYFLHTC